MGTSHPKCTLSVLPFHQHNLSLSNTSCMSKPGAEDPDFADEHLNLLHERPHQLRIFHINTQSMASSFDKLLATIKEYRFDVVTMSETWLKDNALLLQYVTIPGYSHVFRNGKEDPLRQCCDIVEGRHKLQKAY